ncbi:hypothetical protein [Glutamicibacter sp. X7]
MDDLSELKVAQSLKPYLATIDPAKLKSKIARYERLARQPRTREQIDRDIYEVLLSRHENGTASAAFPANTRRFERGTKLYRARILNHVDDVSQLSDVWEAPEPYVRAGRLNIPREPLIYTSVHNPSTAAFEVRMKPGDIYAMIEYKMQLDTSFAPIGEYPKNKYLTMAEGRKLDMLHGFMEDIFTQRADPNDEHIYIAPELLVKNFFDWPLEMSQAWGYRSLAEPGGNGYNLCFRPEVAKKHLEVDHVVIGVCEKFTDEGIHFSSLKFLQPVVGSSKLEPILTTVECMPDSIA